MRIAVAHGSRAAIDAVARCVSDHAEHRIVWTARDGAEAIRACREAAPDLLLLDAGLSGPNAVEVVRNVIAQKSCAVLLLGQPKEHQTVVYSAMGLGALDVVTCPSMSALGTILGGDELLAKLRTARHLLGPVGHVAPRAVSSDVVSPHAARKLVVIGASTGGPQALHQILSELPRDFRPAIVIVQHVDHAFTAGLATWLGQAGPMAVELAAAGGRPTAGVVHLSASNEHLVMTSRGTFGYTPEPRSASCCPSVDALFQSLAQHWPHRSVAVLLTGMGKDGALGMKSLRDIGWRTIAQDSATSVVFGMPKAAIDLGAAEQVLPLSAIAAAIVRACE